MMIWMQILLQAKANVHHRASNGDTALSWAAHNGHRAVLSPSLLWTLSQACLLQVVEILLSSKARPHDADHNQVTPLIWAAQNGHRTVASTLVSLSVCLAVTFP